jgi:hypothetical protein
LAPFIPAHVLAWQAAAETPLLPLWLPQERRAYVPAGWSKAYEFSLADLRSGADIIELACRAGGKGQGAWAAVPWQYLHGLLESAIYGGRVDNAWDMRVGMLRPSSMYRRCCQACLWDLTLGGHCRQDTGKLPLLQSAATNARQHSTAQQPHRPPRATLAPAAAAAGAAHLPAAAVQAGAAGPRLQGCPPARQPPAAALQQPPGRLPGRPRLAAGRRQPRALRAAGQHRAQRGAGALPAATLQPLLLRVVLAICC